MFTLKIGNFKHICKVYLNCKGINLNQERQIKIDISNA